MHRSRRLPIRHDGGCGRQYGAPLINNRNAGTRAASITQVILRVHDELVRFAGCSGGGTGNPPTDVERRLDCWLVETVHPVRTLGQPH